MFDLKAEPSIFPVISTNPGMESDSPLPAGILWGRISQRFRGQSFEFENYLVRVVDTTHPEKMYRIFLDRAGRNGVRFWPELEPWSLSTRHDP